MYQLSHLLTEQSSLFVMLMENSLLGDRAPGLRGVEPKPEPKTTKIEEQLSVSADEGRKKLTALLERVEGCAVFW